ncbi:MAG TPA: efflux RND transporter periplasmic adaptor subunit [Thermoanaerobaculia bacterium]|nr:efflux RND transporter periplasmic adaptor subunit [Thermoanaerobaculia bacterium]
MKKRMALMLVAIAVFVTAIGAVKYGQIKKGMAQQAAFQPPPEAVTTVVAKSEQWTTTLTAIGTVAAVQGVVVSADLPGIVEKIAFESGQRVRAGDVLVLLDMKQERAQLAAAEAQLELARVSLDRMKRLVETQIGAQADLDSAEANFKAADARVGELRATIERKTIRAPFAGVLGIRQVNLGQYLQGGSPVVPLQALQPIYVNFSVPQQEIARMRVGGEVRVTNAAQTGPGSTGRITAIDSVIDPGTRNVAVQATLPNADGKLQPGMFVQTSLGVGTTGDIVAIPASSINHAPYGDSVFIVTEMKDPKGNTYKGVRQQFVKVGPGQGDQVAILSGIKPGEEVVTSGVFKLRNGAAVQVNNKTQPGNNPAPNPENS